MSAPLSAELRNKYGVSQANIVLWLMQGSEPHTKAGSPSSDSQSPVQHRLAVCKHRHGLWMSRLNDFVHSVHVCRCALSPSARTTRCRLCAAPTRCAWRPFCLCLAQQRPPGVHQDNSAACCCGIQCTLRRLPLRRLPGVGCRAVRARSWRCTAGSGSSTSSASPRTRRTVSSVLGHCARAGIPLSGSHVQLVPRQRGGQHHHADGEARRGVAHGSQPTEQHSRRLGSVLTAAAGNQWSS